MNSEAGQLTSPKLSFLQYISLFMIFYFVFLISGTEWKDKESGTNVESGTGDQKGTL